MANYLDETGLARVWGKVKGLFTKSNVETALGHTIDKNVPSNAVFTDSNVTQTKTTSSTTGKYDVLLSGSVAGSATDTTGTKKSGQIPVTYDPASGKLLIGVEGEGVFAYLNPSNILVGNFQGQTPKTCYMSEDDVVLYHSTWDGSNTSLRTAVSGIKSSLSDLENITVGTPRKVGKWGNYDRYEVWLEGTTPAMTANTWTQIKSYTFNTASIIEKLFTISDSGGLIFNDYYTSTTSYLTSYIKSDGIYLRVGNASAFTGQKFYCKVTYVS